MLSYPWLLLLVSSVLVNHPSTLLLGTPCPIVSIDRCESGCCFTANLNLLVGFSRQKYWSGVPLPSLIIIATPGYIPKSRIAELNGNILFNFLINCQTVFQSGCTILHSYQQCWKILVSPHPPPILTIFFLVLAILVGVTEKAMAPHSSTLAWKIPWMEEPGRLQSMGSLRVGHDWATSLWLFTFMHRRRKWQPTPVFLPGESQGRGSLVGCRLWGRTESDTTEAT